MSKTHFDGLTRQQKNELGRVLSTYKTSANIRPRLAAVGLSEREIDIAETMSFSKFGHLSVKACDKLIPFLEKGMTYDEACTAAGYDFKGHDGETRTRLLHPTEEDFADVTSPVVRRAISQIVKVLNAIIRERGSSPTFINIDLAREMARDFAERSKMKKDMDENRTRNEQIMARIRTEYSKEHPTGQDLVKFKLWEEQHGKCAYSQRHISIERLFEPGYVEVDHIENLLGRSIFALSGGEKQKIAFASVYAMGPEVYLLDEPSSNLDMASIEALRAHLRLIKSQGKTIVAAEHRLYYLMDVADRVIYFENGRIAGDWTPEQLRALPAVQRQELGLRAIDLREERPVCAAVPKQPPMLELQNVSLAYKKQPVLSNISLRAAPGDVIAVVSRNGAGKTTFSRALCGLHKEAFGSYLWNGNHRGRRNARSVLIWSCRT